MKNNGTPLLSYGTIGSSIGVLALVSIVSVFLPILASIVSVSVVELVCEEDSVCVFFLHALTVVIHVITNTTTTIIFNKFFIH